MLFRSINGVRLGAGATTLSESEYERVNSNTTFQKGVKSGLFVVRGGGDLVPDDAPPSGIKKLPQAEAIEVVDGTHDLDTLKGYLEGEKRVKVRNAISLRIKQIEGGEAA